MLPRVISLLSFCVTIVAFFIRINWSFNYSIIANNYKIHLPTLCYPLILSRYFGFYQSLEASITRFWCCIVIMAYYPKDHLSYFIFIRVKIFYLIFHALLATSKIEQNLGPCLLPMEVTIRSDYSRDRDICLSGREAQNEKTINI